VWKFFIQTTQKLIRGKACASLKPVSVEMSVNSSY
jgi:hypothetical protein